MNLTLFLFGNRKVWTGAENRTALLNICLQNRISYTDFRYGEDGSICFLTSSHTAKRLQRLCQAEGIELRILESGGLPPFLWRYRRRAGLMIGAVLSLALMLLSQRFVWDIRITGNETMTETEVREELRACGLFVGSYIPDIHSSELENRVLIASKRISWISVYMDGTVATVQIIEHVEPPPAEDTSRPANLIAAADGQIEVVELYRGNCVVTHGQAVRKGELLVSGLYDSQVEGYRFTRAAGKILARIERDFRVEIPLFYEEKTYLESNCEEITLKFFDFSLILYKKTGNTEGMCDIIREEKGLDMLGGKAIPVGLSLSHSLPYTLKTAERTPEEALELAYADLERELAALSADAQLLGKSIRTTLTDTSLILECTVTCIEDIAVQSEFEITD